jgi:glycosyltransferase involved in cell wall biosynthesis
MDMEQNMKLVSVICLSFNHEPFIADAVASVLNQSYGNIELIIVDDASTDGSREVIRELKSRHPEIKILLKEENEGNCRAFNQGFAMSSGDFVVDLAADDAFLPDRIEKQVAGFERLGTDYGVLFHDAVYVSSTNKTEYHHFTGPNPKVTIDEIPTGKIYRQLLRKYLIAAPTMMIRRETLESIGGYDEKLAYEDFDFWVRTGQRWKYGYQDEVLTQIRLLDTSLSEQVKKKENRLVSSTYTICLKAFILNKHRADHKALLRRILTETKAAFFSQNYVVVFGYFNLYIKTFIKVLRSPNP